jgi:hypothetical protein
MNNEPSLVLIWVKSNSEATLLLVSFFFFFFCKFKFLFLVGTRNTKLLM